MSSLKQQLAALQLAPGAKKAKGKASLLWDFRAASDVDLQAIYELGTAGFDDLVLLEPRYAAVREPLFSRVAASVSRDQQTPEVVARLNTAIDEFCCLLAQHFLLPAAFKALEYLIRRFKANEHNIDSLMLAALPYHGTNEFVRLLQLLPLDPSRGLWSWLAPAQASGASVPRELLVARCVNDPRVLHFVCQGARKLGGRKGRSSSYMSFYAVAMCEVIAAAQTVDEPFLSRLLPFISSGLEKSASRDYQAATLIMVAELCSRATLGKDFVKAVLNSTLRNIEHQPDTVRPILLLLAQVSSTQPQLTSLPEKALKALLTTPHFVSELAALHASHVRLAPLLRVVTASLVARIASSAGSVEVYVAPLLELVHSGLLEQVAQSLALQVLHAAAEQGASADTQAAFQRVLCALDLRHPEAMDATVNGALAPLRGSSRKKESQCDSSEEEQEESGSKYTRHRAIFAVVQSAFGGAGQGSVRALCGNIPLTLTAAAASPAASVRRMAVQQMGSMLMELDPAASSSEARAELQSGILKGLQDDDMEVVVAALGLPCIPHLPLAALLPTLQLPLKQIRQLLCSPTKASHGTRAAGTAARKAAHLLAAVAAVESAEGQSEAQDQALLLLLQFAMPVRRALKVTKAVLNAADQIDHPLARALASLQGLAAGLDAPAADAQHDRDEGGGSAGGNKKKGSKSGGGKKGKKGGKEESVVETDDGQGQQQGGKAKWMAKAEQKRAQEEAAWDLEQAVVNALGQAIAADPANLLPEVLRLLALARGDSYSCSTPLSTAQAEALDPNEAVQGRGSSCGTHAEQAADPGLLRVRHVLLLALHRALAVAGEDGNEGKGSKASRGGSKSSSVTAEVATGLISACFPELRATLPLLQQIEGERSVLEHWKSDAEDLVELGVPEEKGFPLAEHAEAIASRPHATHFAMLCAALHAAMESVPELDAAQGVEGNQVGEDAAPCNANASTPPPSATKSRGKAKWRQLQQHSTPRLPVPSVHDMFVGLGALQPANAFQDHLTLLVEKALPGMQTRVAFLAALYAAPEEQADQGPMPDDQPAVFHPPASVRAAALNLHKEYIHSSLLSSKQQQDVGITLQFLPHLLTAARSPHAEVRTAAVEALHDVESQLGDAAQDTKGEQGTTAAALTPLLDALLRHAQLVEADADAVVVLLRNTFAGAGSADAEQRGDAAQAKQPERAGRGGRSKASKASAPAGTSSGRGSQQKLVLASSCLDMEGGAAAVDAAFAQLARLLPRELRGQLPQAARSQRKQTEDTEGVQGRAHVAHTLLLGMLQEPWSLNSTTSSDEGTDPPNQTQTSAEGAAGKGSWELPAAATPSQRLALLPHAFELLQSLLRTAPQPLSLQAQHVGALLVGCVYHPETLAAHTAKHATTASLACDLLLTLLACSSTSPGAHMPEGAASRPWFDASMPLRLAALRALRSGPPFRAVQALQGSSNAQQQHEFHASLVLSLAMCSAGDASPECRAAASAVLEALPISDAAVVPVLQAASTAASGLSQPQQMPAEPDGVQETPSKKAKKASKMAGTAIGAIGTDGSLATAGAQGGRLDLAVLMLEVLQWKAVQGEEHVLAAAQQLLEALVSLMGPLAQPHSASSPDSEDEEAGGVQGSHQQRSASKKESKAYRQQQQASVGGVTGSSLAGYAAQLILTLMESVARQQSPQSQQQQPHRHKRHNREGASSAVDAQSLPLVVRVAQRAPDSSVRNAALSLLAVLASAKPQAVLSHVLEVLAIVQRSSAATDDTYSLRVALTALAAVVPAWLEAGKGLQELWACVVDALPSLPAHRRLLLLSALLQASPQEPSLPCALVTLLQSAADALEVPQAPAGEEHGAGAAAATPKPSEWLMDLATQLSLQVPHQTRLVCFAELLPASVKVAQGQAAAILPRIAVTFVAEQIKSRALRNVHAKGGASNDEHQKGCEAIMAQALSQVQGLVSAREQLSSQEEPAANKKASAKKGSKAPDATAVRRQERAIRLSIEGLYKLLAGLQGIMASQSYMEALLRLAASPGDKVCRRALRLFAEKAAGLPTEFDRILHTPGMPNKEKEAQANSLAQAALQVCPVLSSPNLNSASSLTRQAALLAYTSVLRGCGSSYPQPLLAVLPTAVACATEDPSCAVRGTALAAIAAAAAACGAQLVPVLPQASNAVLRAMESACAKLSTSEALAAGTAAAAAAAERREAGVPKQHAEDKEETGEDAEAVIELAAALSALGALVQRLGPFLSPYLPRVLRALLHPATLARGTPSSKATTTGSNNAGGVAAGGEGGSASPSIAAAAASVRSALPVCVPARLLLQPLFASLPHAMAGGGMGPMAALMRMVAAAAAGMEAAVAAAHHEAIFGFLLRALDVRHTAPAALRGFEPLAEQAAISALVALVLKLSEARFKPLFLRLLEWATLPANAGGGSGGLGRLVALFGAMDALSVHLRSVLVPYYRYVIDLCVQHLAYSSSEPGRPKKKQRKQQQALNAAGMGGDAAAVDAWVLKGRVLRALQRCFLYDSVGFVDQDKVERLLPALVEQLSMEPPSEEAAAAVAAQCSAPDLDSSLRPGPRTPRDTYGLATVGALVHLAVAANSDLHWKPLNRQVLLQTRSASSRTRCLALEVVAHMLDRLREEYLSLLPETLPFLSELIEDPDSAVEARAQDVVKLLEEVSGEKLDEYLKTA